jgi:sugar phosphate isomerase/epimerase
MMKLNIFYEHIFEGAAQQGISLEKMLAMANSIGITGLECDLWRLSDRENIKSLFDNCGMKAASVYNMFDMGHCCWNENEKKVHELLETASYFGADKVLAIPGLVRRGEDGNELRKRMSEQLNRMCEVAADHGITVTHFVYTGQCRKVLRACNTLLRSRNGHGLSPNGNQHHNHHKQHAQAHHSFDLLHGFPS